jgi:hypothetical protein
MNADDKSHGNRASRNGSFLMRGPIEYRTVLPEGVAAPTPSAGLASFNKLLSG